MLVGGDPWQRFGRGRRRLVSHRRNGRPVSQRGKGEVAVVLLVQGLDQLVARFPEHRFDLSVRNAGPPSDVNSPIEQVIGIGHAADGLVVRDGPERAGDRPVDAQQA